MNLRRVLDEAADGLSDIEAGSAPDGATIWQRSGQTFAVLSADGNTTEFGLDPAVAAAATRTPDVTPSDRGPGWVLFRPVILDAHGADRAGAWFASAHRRLERP